MKYAALVVDIFEKTSRRSAKGNAAWCLPISSRFGRQTLKYAAGILIRTQAVLTAARASHQSGLGERHADPVGERLRSPVPSSVLTSGEAGRAFDYRLILLDSPSKDPYASSSPRVMRH